MVYKVYHVHDKTPTGICLLQFAHVGTANSLPLGTPVVVAEIAAHRLLSPTARENESLGEVRFAQPQRLRDSYLVQFSHRMTVFFLSKYQKNRVK